MSLQRIKQYVTLTEHCGQVVSTLDLYSRGSAFKYRGASILTEVHHGVPPYLQANARILP
jgi:hypothetical protein